MSAVCTRYSCISGTSGSNVAIKVPAVNSDVLDVNKARSIKLTIESRKFRDTVKMPHHQKIKKAVESGTLQNV